MSSSKSKLIKYYSKKTSTPIALSTPTEWISSTSGNLYWQYTDSDVQEYYTIEVYPEDGSGTKRKFEVSSEDNFISLISMGITTSGKYHWAVQVKGTQSTEPSDFSKPQQLLIDTGNPSIKAVDIVSVSGDVEYHSNLNPPIISDLDLFDNAICIYNDLNSKLLTLYITDKIKANIGNSRGRDRTYFINLTVPYSSSVNPSNISTPNDIYYIIENQPENNQYKLYVSLFVPDSAESKNRLHDSSIKEWYIQFPHEGLVIAESYFINTDVSLNIKQILEPNFNIETNTFLKSYTTKEINNFITQQTDETIKTNISRCISASLKRSSKKLIKIGRTLSPIITYKETDSTNFIPKYGFALGIDTINKLETIDNAYYFSNSETKNSVNDAKISPANTFSTNLNSTVFDEFQEGDLVEFLNSNYYYYNNAYSAVTNNKYRDLRNTFEITDIDSGSKIITLNSGTDATGDNVKKIFGFSNIYLNGNSTVKTPLLGSALTRTTDELGNVITILTDATGGFDNLPFSTENSGTTGNHRLCNRFIGIKHSSTSYREYVILDNSATTLSIQGDVILQIEEDLGTSLAASDSLSYYITGDTYSIHIPSFIISSNIIKIFVRTSNNSSGIKGIKVIEKPITNNQYPTSTLDSPNISISTSNIRSDYTNLAGPQKYGYYVTTVDSTGAESIESNIEAIDILISNSRYVNISWEKVDDNTTTSVESYRVYRGLYNKDELYDTEIPSRSDFYLIAEVPTTHVISGTNTLYYNDFGNPVFSEGFNSTIVSGFTASVNTTQNKGFFKSGLSYYYYITTYKYISLTWPKERDLLISAQVTTTHDNDSIILAWTKPTTASLYQGYKIFRSTTITSTPELLVTINNKDLETWTDPGESTLDKSNLLLGNIKYIRTRPTDDEIFVNTTQYIDAIDLLNFETSPVDQDIKYINYIIQNSTSPNLELYISALNNAGLETVTDQGDDTSYELMSSVCVSRFIPKKQSIIFDKERPTGLLSVYGSTICDSGNDGRGFINLNYSSIKSEDLLKVQLSNFNDKWFTNPENSYSGYKWWQMNYYVHLLTEETGNEATKASDTDTIQWIKIKVTTDPNDSGNPLCISNLIDYAHNLIGKKVFFTNAFDENTKLTCIDVSHDGADNYVLYLAYEEASFTNFTQIINTISKGMNLYIPVSYLGHSISSTYGLNGYVEYMKDGVKTLKHVIDYEKIDFKETNGTTLYPSQLAEDYRSQSNISPLNVTDPQNNSKELHFVWNGYLYAPYNATYMLSLGVCGSGARLYLDNDVDNYYKYIKYIKEFYETGTGTDTSNVKAEKIRNSNGENYSTLTINTGIEGSANIVILETVSSETQTGNWVNGKEISLSKGWHKIRIEYNYTPSTSQINNQIVNLAYTYFLNKGSGSTDLYSTYPRIYSFENNTITIDSDYYLSETKKIKFQENSLKDSILMLIPYDMTTGSLATVDTKDNLEINNASYFSADTTNKTVTNTFYSTLFNKTTLDATIYKFAYNDNFSVSTSKLNENFFSFARISSMTESSDTFSVVMKNGGTLDPEFKYSTITNANLGLKIFTYPLRIASNTENTITLYPAISGTITAITQYTTYSELTCTGINLSSRDNFKYYGYPIFLNAATTSTPAELQSQVLKISGNIIRINTVLTDEQIEDITDGGYVNTPYSLGDLNDLNRLSIINTIDTGSSGSIFYVPVGKIRQIIPTEFLSKNAMQIYAKFYDRAENVYQTSIIVKFSTNITPPPPDPTDIIYSNGVVEYGIGEGSEGNIRYTTIGTQVYDASIVDQSIGIFESDPIVGGNNFEFWTSIQWDGDYVDADDIKVEVRTAPTEEELLTKTYNEDAFGTIYPAYTSDVFDTPVDIPTGINILHYTSNGNLDQNSRLIKNRFLQFKITLLTTSINYTPTLRSVTVNYSTSNAVLLLTNNFELDSNFVRGILTANTEIPNGTSIIFGITTDDETDFQTFYRFEIDEVFELPENLRNNQFRIGCQLISSESAIPRIYEMAFQFETELGEKLINLTI